MAQTWAEALNANPHLLDLGPERLEQEKRNWFRQTIASTPEFKGLPREGQQALTAKMIADDTGTRLIRAREEKAARARLRDDLAQRPNVTRASRRAMIENRLGVSEGEQPDVVTNPAAALGRSFAREYNTNTSGGDLIKSGRRAMGLTPPEEDSFYTDGPLATAAGMLGATLAQAADPTNAVPGAKGAAIARAVTPIAGQGARATARAVVTAAARGAVPAAKQGAALTSLASAARQYGDTGEVDAGRVLADTTAGTAMSAALGGLPAAAAGLPEGRLNPALPEVDTEALGQTAQRLMREEHGTFDADALMRTMGFKRAMRTLKQSHQEALDAGDQVMADHINDQIERMRDARVTLENRPADGSSLAEPTRYYNERKYNFASPESREKFDQLTREAVHEHGLDPKQRIPQSEIVRRAQEMTGSSVDDLKYMDLKFGESLSAVEYEAAKNTVDSLKERAVTLEQQLNALPGTTPPDVRRGLEIELNSVERDIKGFMGVLIPSRSQKGRDLAYLKMVAQQGWDDAYWAARASRISQTPYDPRDPNFRELDAIVRRGREADMRADTDGVRQARIDLAKFMGKLERTPVLEAISAFRKAGLLTGMKTIARNMGSNMTNQVLEEAVRLPASVIDSGLSMLTGNRTVLAPTPGKIAQGLHASATKGMREFGETMVHGVPLEQLANLEISREVNTGIRPLDVYMNTVFRFQNAQDRIFKAYAYTRSLRDQAELLVRRDGTPPAQRAARVQAIMDDPVSTLGRQHGEEVVREAIADAEFATFTNDTLINDKLTAFTARGKNTRSGQALNFAIDQIMPFKKTPSAVAMRVLEYASGALSAPLSVGGQRAAAAVRSRDLAPLVQALTPQEQKAIALGMSRGMVGASLITMGAILARQGMLSGTYNPATREVDEAAGRTAGAMKINGQWVPIGALSPVGNLLIMGATLYRDGFNDKTVTAAAVRAVLDQPFTQGAKEVADVLKPDAEGLTKAVGKMAGNMAGSWVPTIAAETAQAFDPLGVDRAVSREYPQSAFDTIRKRLPVPGGRGALDPKTTMFGDRIPVPSGPAAYWAFAGRPAAEDADPTVRRLVEAGGEMKGPSQKVHIPHTHEDLQLTPQLFTNLKGIFKQAFDYESGQIPQDWWNSATPEQRKEAMDWVRGRALQQAKSEFWRRYANEAGEAYRAQQGGEE